MCGTIQILKFVVISLFVSRVVVFGLMIVHVTIERYFKELMTACCKYVKYSIDNANCCVLSTDWSLQIN